MSIYTQLANIQAKLKAPKNQFNAFGKYNYRSCEDILEAVKPLLDGFVLVISDEVIQIGSRIYIKATVTLTDGKETITNTAWAREEEDKKGMDGSQITGAASSYARKYALNGMFLIDDNKDSDSTNHHGKDKAEPPKEEKKSPPKEERQDAVSDGKTKTADDLKHEMAKWFEQKYGEDALDKFTQMTKGIYDNPLSLTSYSVISTVYKHFLKYKEATDAE